MSALSKLDAFRRVYDAYAVLDACGIGAETLLGATTNNPDAAQVGDFQSAVRALYAKDDWRNVIQPINDEMRVGQRDALTAQVLQLLRNQVPQQVVDLDAPIDTAERLFEFLLMDVRMECCMLTSRIRHALSSVQLYIERCLRSLELNPTDATKNVMAACFSRSQWSWRKRFRYWQVNRECGLWPGNWLYPDVRDDQSPIFKSVMSKLLQSDITDDAATSAYLDYLSELEQVAKLEPCAMYYVPADAANQVNETVHVVARSPGAKRTYYYRKFEGVSWSAWEQIKLSIDDNPVAFGVSNGRLLLFWLQVVHQTTEAKTLPAATTDADAGGDDKSTGTPITTQNVAGVVSSVLQSDTTTAGTTMVGVNLCWSEYHNNKWQPAKTSDTKTPCMLGEIKSTDAGQFDLAVFADPDDSQKRLWIQVGGNGTGCQFLFYNTHSTPIPQPSGFPEEVLPPNPYQRVLSISPYAMTANSSTLLVNYNFDNAIDQEYFVDIVMTTESRINPTMAGSIVPQAPPSGLRSRSSWTWPFIYADTSSAFYVTPSPAQLVVREFQPFAIPPESSRIYYQIPNMMNRWAVRQPPVPLGDPAYARDVVGAASRSATARLVSQDAYISRGLATGGTVAFGDRDIGPSGVEIE